MLFAAITLISAPAAAQQNPNAEYAPSVECAANSTTHEVIAIDGGHDNFHQLNGRFGPFGLLANHCGFHTTSLNTEITAQSLEMDLLVISNAATSLSSEEVEALLAWIRAGGSLLLIADHAPFGDVVAPLAARFGVTMGGGYVVIGEGAETEAVIDFSGDSIGDHQIMRGENSSRPVQSVRSFLGQSLAADDEHSVLLTLPQDSQEFASGEEIVAWARDGVQGTARAGSAQAIALEYGHGRVVIAGEAAMFTSQVAEDDDGSIVRVGLESADNEAFVTNILGWLGRRF